MADNITVVQIDGLQETGTEIGGFLQNMAPGFAVFLLILAIVGGLTLIFRAIFKAVGNKMK